MKEAMTPKTNPVMVLSAAAATGHLGQRMRLSPPLRHGVSRTHIEVLRYTNPIFRKIYLISM